MSRGCSRSNVSLSTTAEAYSIFLGIRRSTNPVNPRRLMYVSCSSNVLSTPTNLVISDLAYLCQ